ncbi:unnamed protein product, partial [Gadus morhua 'NCC']
MLTYSVTLLDRQPTVITIASITTTFLYYPHGHTRWSGPPPPGSESCDGGQPTNRTAAPVAGGPLAGQPQPPHDSLTEACVASHRRRSPQMKFRRILPSRRHQEMCPPSQ